MVFSMAQLTHGMPLCAIVHNQNGNIEFVAFCLRVALSFISEKGGPDRARPDTTLIQMLLSLTYE